MPRRPSILGAKRERVERTRGQKSRLGPTFTFQSTAGCSRETEMRGQDLDGDGPLQPGVGRFVDLPHAPGPEGGLDLIRAEAGAAL